MKAVDLDEAYQHTGECDNHLKTPLSLPVYRIYTFPTPGEILAPWLPPLVQIVNGVLARAVAKRNANTLSPQDWTSGSYSRKVIP
jgi:hypothetical protein